MRAARNVTDGLRAALCKNRRALAGDAAFNKKADETPLCAARRGTLQRGRARHVRAVTLDGPAEADFVRADVVPGNRVRC